VSGHDEGVYLCGRPDCEVCWLYGPRTPEWEARVRATLAVVPFLAPGGPR
jgi:hypothetical protein